MSSYYLEEADRCMENDDELGAIANFESYLKIADDYDPLIITQLGILYVMVGYLKLAKNVFESVLNVAPEYANAYLGMGFIADKEGRPYEALELFRQALEYDEENEHVIFHIGELLARLGKNDKIAIKCFKTLLAMGEFEMESYSELFDIYVRLGKYKKAMACLNYKNVHETSNN